MVLAAMWLQTADSSPVYLKWIAIFVGIIMVAMVFQGVATAIFAARAAALLLDLKKSFDETKGKALPIMANVHDITLHTQAIIRDLTPKIKTVSENVVETSHTVRQTVDRLDIQVRQAADKASITFEDANARTQRQVARVDGMVASTLAATAELGATINHGIRVPARKIAEMVTHSKHLFDTLLDRARAFSAGVSTIVQKPVGKNDKVDW